MSPSATNVDEFGPEEPTLEPIAICGMSCRLPGGVDSESSFWSMLVEKRNGQTPKVPASRFNIDAHLHENPDRPGSFNVAGGYFLHGAPEDFDPTFFGMTPIEAQWLDPQQRRMLEVSYEALVSAGVTLDQISGTNTAVFVGSFTSDYQQMSIKDPDFRHNYAATGVDPGIISNRIGNAFNLNGPSFTINTACSSSIYALHNACHALRSRDCDAAIVGGVNLIMTVDQHMNTAKLGILSPTSTCHTFDASADGYGRAEGAGALYIKRLADAMRDGDPIRSVIRSTAVNTNGKVDGMGITHPSVRGQERVVRLAYKKASLDPNLTAYAELHGTGTPVGDPIEVRAISRALNDTRPADKPLLIGAVKPNIGHSEAASGIFAVMKASLMTEAALIPGVAFFERLNPDIQEKEWNVKIHSDTAPWPKDSLSLRRASISSFGYGGTNGHVIIEAVESLYPWYQHASAKKRAAYNRSTKRPFLLTLSAHDKATLGRNASALAAVADRYYLPDLVHTLNIHRTKFSHRAYAVVREGGEAEALQTPLLQTGSVSKKGVGIGFLFTGQGAQWVGMGKVAIQEFPVVADTIRKLDNIMRKMHPKPTFRVMDLLLDSDCSPEAAGRINDADVAQPLCTALQIAIVDLLAQWDVTPEVSVGHSSGEIGAAYAAGLISAPEAIAAAFYRGQAVVRHSPAGTMLAVGVGADDEALAEILPSDQGEACVACENSPSSTTLSGRCEAIATVRDALHSRGVFVRELRTGRAYHSPHMAAVGDAYDEMLDTALRMLARDHCDELRDWRRPRSAMVSSITGEFVDGDALPKGYFSANLRQRVQFSTAVSRMAGEERLAHVNTMIEVGPHSALAGPFKQIIASLGETTAARFSYIPSLQKGSNDADRLLGVAAVLFVAGFDVDLNKVNANDEADGCGLVRKPKTQHLLVDLPPYQWNYERKYWAEPRGSVEQRSRVFPRHDLLGSRVSGLSTRSEVWRNLLRQRDVPWLRDHALGGSAIFPAAGHLSLAIEALRQTLETAGLPFEGFKLRDVDIKTALVVPDADDGVETIVRLTADESEDNSVWYSFSVESLPNNQQAWIAHCSGRVAAVTHAARNHPVTTPVDGALLTQRVSGKRWYQAFRRVGFAYTKTFQQVRSVQTETGLHQATGDIAVRTTVMDGESRYLVHPATVDACLQLIIISIHEGRHKEMPWGVVPTHIEDAVIFPASNATDGHAEAWTDTLESRRFNTSCIMRGPDGGLLLEVRNLTCVTYDAALPAGAAQAELDENSEPLMPQPFSFVAWKPDIAMLVGLQGGAKLFASCFPDLASPEHRLTKFVELIHHRQPVTTILIAGLPRPSRETIEAVLAFLPSTVSATVGVAGEQEGLLDVPQRVLSRISVKTLGQEFQDWVASADGLYDVVLIDAASEGDNVQQLLSLVNDDGWLIGSAAKLAATIGNPQLQVGQQFAMMRAKDSKIDAEGTNGVYGKTRTVHEDSDFDENSSGVIVPDNSGCTTPNDTITVLSLSGADLTLTDTLCAQHSGPTVEHEPLSTFELDPAKHSRIIVDDTRGTILEGILSSPDTFAAVKAVLAAASSLPLLWLTQDVHRVASDDIALEAAEMTVGAGMAEGLLRAVRSEQAAARVALLDVDGDTAPEAVADAALAILDAVEIKDSGRDTEFWLQRNGVLHTARVYPDDKLNRALITGEVLTNERSSGGPGAKARLSGEGANLRPVALQQVGEADENPVIIFQTLAAPEEAAGGIEMQILAAETNVSSTNAVYFSTSMERLVVGTVTKAGPGAEAGQRVVATIPAHHDGLPAIIVRTDKYAVVDTTVAASNEQLAGTLSSLASIVHLWRAVQRNNYGKEELVLCLPGPKPIVTALARLGCATGWTNLVLTVTSEATRTELIESGSSSDQVLLLEDGAPDNVAETLLRQQSDISAVLCLDGFAPLSQECWRRMPAGGAFFMMTPPHASGGDMVVKPDPVSFARGASFVPVGMRSGPSVAVLREAVDLVMCSPELLLDCDSEYHIVDLTEAVGRKTSSIQDKTTTTIVRYDFDETRAKILDAPKQVQLSSDVSYLLVGCLGGLGRSLTRWMMDRGARHFAFVSRSGANKPEAAALVAQITADGASADVYHADAADADAMDNVVRATQRKRPIGGAVHAAMVLRDGMFDGMDAASFAAAVTPKAVGAMCLQHALVKHARGSLDFLVMTSSISAVLGNMGQSNYAAANSVLDTLARRWPATCTSLVLPMVLDVGVVAENESIETSLARKGLYGVNETEMLRGFGAAMGRCSRHSDKAPPRYNAHMVMGLETRELARSIAMAEEDGGVLDAYWYHDARLAHVRTALERGKDNKEASGGGGGDDDLAAAIQAAQQQAAAAGAQRGSADAVVMDVISERLAKRVSGILMIRIEDIELDGPSLASYGLDSMIGAEMRTWLFREFAVDYPFQKLLAPTLTFRGLAEVVAEKLRFLPAKTT